MADPTLTLLLEPRTPDALTGDQLDAMTRALRQQLDLPELTARASLAEAPPDLTDAGSKGLAQALGRLVLEVLPETVPALVEFLSAWVKRESRVRIKVQAGGDAIELDFDARTIDEARVEAMAERILQRLGRRRARP